MTVADIFFMDSYPSISGADRYKMIHKIPQGTLDVKKLLPHIVGGGMSNTNGMPLIIFLDDQTVLKISPHFKTDYDLALERHNETPKQWQGINSAVISHVISSKVPGVTGVGADLGSFIAISQVSDITRELANVLLGENGTPIIDNANRYFFVGKYFERVLSDIQTNRAYDEFVVLRMPEYNGFLSNIYALPATFGMYDTVIRAALFEVSFYYYKIKKYLPTFKHNDLHMENVMIQPEERLEEVAYRLFIFNGTEYYVPYFGYSLRIIDFGLSSLPEAGINSVLDNTTILSDTAERGEETKFLLRFVSMNPTNVKDLLGDDEVKRDDYISNGFMLTDDIFKVFRSRGKKDTRSEKVVGTVTD